MVLCSEAVKVMELVTPQRTGSCPGGVTGGSGIITGGSGCIGGVMGVGITGVCGIITTGGMLTCPGPSDIAGGCTGLSERDGISGGASCAEASS